MIEVHLYFRVLNVIVSKCILFSTGVSGRPTARCPNWQDLQGNCLGSIFSKLKNREVITILEKPR